MQKGRKAQTQDQLRVLCIQCNKNLQMEAKKSVLGYRRFVPLCSSCTKKKYGTTNRKYRAKKKPHCERCGFIPVHMCQLDVHHIDRNHSNNKEHNLLTLCANCHRLEHQIERETNIWNTK